MSASEAILLGQDGEGPVVAAIAGVEPEELPETIKAIDHRSVNVPGPVRRRRNSARWRRQPRCFPGTPAINSAASAASRPRSAPAATSGSAWAAAPSTFRAPIRSRSCWRSPRTNACMGRGAHFAPGMYSSLAGFIEPGETIEAAVRRETLEEAGIRLGRVVYHASQPWPFPYSLMIGCFGEALNEDIHRDETELGGLPLVLARRRSIHARKAPSGRHRRPTAGRDRASSHPLLGGKPITPTRSPHDPSYRGVHAEAQSRLPRGGRLSSPRRGSLPIFRACRNSSSCGRSARRTASVSASQWSSRIRQPTAATTIIPFTSRSCAIAGCPKSRIFSRSTTSP